MDEASILDEIYDAAIHPHLWVKVLERFADLVGGAGAIISRASIVTGRGDSVGARIPPSMVLLYNTYYNSLNVLNNVSDPVRYAQNWAPIVLTDEDVIAKSDLVLTEYYNDFMRPFDVHSTLFVRLALRGFEHTAITVNRPRSRGPFDGKSLELAERLRPHFLRAFDLGTRLVGDRSVVESAAAVFDRSKDALFLVDRFCRLLKANRAGEALIRERRFTVVHGLLTASGTEAGRTFNALVGRAGSADREVRAGHSMTLRSPDLMWPMLVTITPAGVEIAGFPPPGGTVMVSVVDLERDVRVRADQLVSLFGLTRAESRLAAALLVGGDIPAAAGVAGVSANTAKNHLSRIFEKTGTKRQGALIKLMMRLAEVAADEP